MSINRDPKKSYAKSEALIESWGDRISVVESIDGAELPFEKKVVLAQCLENTQAAIDLQEATDAGDTSGFKHFALDLVTAVVPNLVANDIVSVQPIDNTVKLLAA